MAKCPNCGGTGAINHQPEQRVSREMAQDAGDLALEGSIYTEESWDACDICGGSGEVKSARAVKEPR
jgi:DnaJ-class molecular chaperone